MLRIVEYEPMAAKAIQEQIHKGFECENGRFMDGAQNSMASRNSKDFVSQCSCGV